MNVIWCKTYVKQKSNMHEMKSITTKESRQSIKHDAIVYEMTNGYRHLTWCRLAGSTMSCVGCGWVDGVVAGAGVGELPPVSAPAAATYRAAVAMALGLRGYTSLKARCLPPATGIIYRMPCNHQSGK